MISIYLVRRGEVWLTYGLIAGKFTADVCAAEIFSCRESAEEAAQETGGEPVEFREVAGDTAAGALAAAEATIARMREELEMLRPKVYGAKVPVEKVVGYLESTDG